MIKKLALTTAAIIMFSLAGCASPMPSPTPTFTPSPTAIPTETPTLTPTLEPTETPTFTPEPYGLGKINLSKNPESTKDISCTFPIEKIDQAVPLVSQAMLKEAERLGLKAEMVPNLGFSGGFFPRADKNWAFNPEKYDSNVTLGSWNASEKRYATLCEITENGTVRGYLLSILFKIPSDTIDNIGYPQEENTKLHVLNVVFDELWIAQLEQERIRTRSIVPPLLSQQEKLDKELPNLDKQDFGFDENGSGYLNFFAVGEINDPNNPIMSPYYQNRNYRNEDSREACKIAGCGINLVKSFIDNIDNKYIVANWRGHLLPLTPQ